MKYEDLSDEQRFYLTMYLCDEADAEDFLDDYCESCFDSWDEDTQRDILGIEAATEVTQ